MQYSSFRKRNLVLGIILSIILFNIYDFFKIRIVNRDLPKGKMVFSSSERGDQEIYLMNVNGSSLERLTSHSFFGPSIDTQICDFNPSFSPDGKRIVFDSDQEDKGPRRENIYDYRGRRIGERGVIPSRDLYLLDLTNKVQQQLTFNMIHEKTIGFSPDGRSILFSAMRNPGGFVEELRLINSYGTERVLMKEFEVGKKALFSPDGRKLFCIFRGDVWEIDIESEARTRLTRFNGQDIEEYWKVDNQLFVNIFALSPDGEEIVFVVQDREGLQFTFFLLETRGGSLRKSSESTVRISVDMWVVSEK